MIPQPLPEPDICIHHAPCPDGFTAAWSLWRRFPNCRFIGAKHGDAPPNVFGMHVVIADFSYKEPVLRSMAHDAASLFIIDHHKSAEADLSWMPSGIRNWDQWAALVTTAAVKCGALFDMNHSGAGLAWRFFNAVETPPLVNYVEDYDLWRFRLDGTQCVQAVLNSYDYDFLRWDSLNFCLLSPVGLGEVMREGEAIVRANTQTINGMLPLLKRTMVIGGVEVPVANVPYVFASTAANIMASAAPFAATYFDRGDGLRVFSLRSVEHGADVSEIAKLYGGGGHKHAAGFTMPHGWLGDARPT